MSTSGGRRKKNRPKTKLGIPDLEHSKAAVLRSLASPDSRRGYQHAIDEFVAWYCSEPRLAFNKAVVLRYRFYLEDRGLAPGAINVRMAAVLGLPMRQQILVLSPELAAGIHRAKGVRKLGSRLGNWSTTVKHRRSSSRPIVRLLGESAIERCWLSCLVAECAAANSQS